VGVFTKNQANSERPIFHYPLKREILVFSVLVILTVPVLFPIRAFMRNRMEEFRDSWIARAEQALGRKISYSSMNPSIFGTLDIRNVRIGSPGESGDDPLPLLAVSRFRISYFFFDLILGRPGAFRSVTIDRPLINIDRDRDGDLLDFFSARDSSMDQVRDILALFPERLALRVKNGRGTYSAEGNTYSAGGVSFEASLNGERITARGKWRADLSLDIPGSSLTAEMTGRVAGAVDRNLRDGEAILTIPSITGNLFRIEKLEAALRLRDDVVSVRKEPDSLPYDYSFDYHIDSGLFSARWEGDDFIPGDLLSFSGILRDYNPFLALRTGGKVEVIRNWEGLRCLLDVSGFIPPDLPIGGASFALSAESSGRYIDFDRCVFNLPQGRFEYRGGTGIEPFAPNGTLVLSNFSLSGEKGLSAELAVATRDNEISVFGEMITIGDTELSALDASLIREDEGLSFGLSVLRFSRVESYEDVRMSSLSLEGSQDPGHVEANIRLDSFSAGDLAAMAAPFTPKGGDNFFQPFLGDISITTEIFVTTDFKHILYNIPRLVVAYDGLGDVAALFSVSGTDQRFELTEGRVVWQDGGMTVTGYAAFENPADISFFLMTSFFDQSYYIEGTFLDRRSLSIQGSYGISAYITASALGGYSGYVEGNLVPVPWRGSVAQLSLSSALRYDSRDFWSLDMDRLELTGLATPVSPAVNFRFSGSADQDGALVPVIFFDDGKGALSGRAVFSWKPDFSDLGGSAFLSGESGDEAYNLETSFSGGSFTLDLSGSRMQIARVIPDSYNALADGTVRLTWNSADSFNAEANLTSLTARIRNRQLQASVEASLDNKSFLMRNLRLSYEGLDAVVPVLSVDLREASAWTEAYINGTAAGRNLAFSLSMESRFRRIESWLYVRDALESFSGSLRVSGARIGSREADSPFDFEFARDASLFTLSGGPQGMIRFRMDGTGDFYAGLSAPSPVRGTFSGTISPKTIDAACPDLYVDLSALWELIPPNPDIALTSGYVTASFDVRGPLGDPEFFGTARGNSVGLRVMQYIPEDIRPVPFTVTIEGNEMNFGPIPARVGTGAGMARGWFRFDRWIPNTFIIDVDVPRETPIPFDFDISGFLARGLAAGSLKISIEDLVFGLKGNLLARNAEMSLNTDEIAAAQNQDLFSGGSLPSVVDITVTTGQKVEFVWPTTGIPILQANADMGTVLKVTSDSMARRFSLVSDVNIRSGEIFYFERSFYIKSGTLIFRENQIQFEPRISARAESRDRSDDGPVTISLIVDNAPLFNFTARLESNPPLSQMEIFSLLGQNMSGTTADGSSVPFISSTVDFLAQFQVVRRFERSIRDFLLLDMFTIRTQLLQNVLFGASGLRNPVDRTAGVGNYFDNTTVFLGKYFSPDFFSQAMLSLRYDANRTEARFSPWELSSGGLPLGGGMILEGEFGIEINGPLFNIRWNFLPLHPENLFIDDTSFTLLWNWSF
jgi:hypothetical protein